jgi:hypothetical protein
MKRTELGFIPKPNLRLFSSTYPASMHIDVGALTKILIRELKL